MTLGRKDTLTKDLLLVENMNHNLLSVGEMCDQGHTILFSSNKCEIRKGKFGKIVATTSRAPNDIYILDEAPKGCFLAKEDESLVISQMNGTYKFRQFGQDQQKGSSKKYTKNFKTYQYDM